MDEQDRFDALFDLQDVSRHEADRLLLDSPLVAHAALGSGRGHGSGHEQYEMRLRAPDGTEVSAFLKPANGLRQSSLEVIDLDRMVLSMSTGRTICWDDDPEEWARSLVGSYRSPYLLAEIVHDDHPVLEPAGERLVVRQRVRG